MPHAIRLITKDKSNGQNESIPHLPKTYYRKAKKSAP